MREALPKAVAAVDDMLSAERCAVLVEAVVTKYIALSPEELQEWQVKRPSCLTLLRCPGISYRPVVAPYDSTSVDTLDQTKGASVRMSQCVLC